VIADLRFLPAIKVDQQWLDLPCPEADLVRLAVALAQPFALACSSHGNPAAVVRAPELLLFALHHFFAAHQRPAASEAELAKWFVPFFREFLPQLTAGWTSGRDNNWSQERIASYTIARENFIASDSGSRKLRKPLIKLIRHLPGCKKKFVKRWIDEIVGEQFDRDKLEAVGDDFAAMFELSQLVHESRKSYERRLQHEKLLSMKQLAYGASHEINNPLANIATRAQSLLTDERHPERRRKLAIVYEQAMRAHEMISDMMLFAHPPEIKLQSVDVYDLVRQVLNEMRSAIRDRNVTADLRRYPQVEDIWIDPTQISVAVKALVRNSLESIEASRTDEPGRIIVRIWPDDDGLLAISVADNGGKLTPDAEKHLFDPFFSGREAGRGLGFGLSKAWRITQLHHGELVWDREYSGGTQFVLRLPIRRKKPVRRIDNVSAA
jgi:signal transduction histidine kinase